MSPNIKMFLALFHVVLLLLLLPFEISASPRTQAEALVRWKNSFSSSSPSSLPSWSLTNLNNLCNWTSIACHSSGAFVSEINLSNTNISATLTGFNFTEFATLTRLDLSVNNIEGSIPSAIGRLSNLNFLNLSNNLLEGNIPPEIGQLLELQYLDFYGNNLTGIVPFQLSNLQKVCYLDLYANSLETPDWSKFSSMPSLTHLDLSSNELRLDFPSFILNCRNLIFLDLSRNYLSGTIPQLLFTNLEKLEYLYLDVNNFSGPIPMEIGHLNCLIDLDLSANQLSGPIPSLFCNSFPLKNNFCGSVSQSYANCSKLRFLDLRENKLEGKLPPSFVNCKSLEMLLVGYNRINDTFPHWFPDLPKLKILGLSSNKFHGPIETFNQVLPPLLKSFNVPNNELTGEIPLSFCNLSSILHLDLSNNRLTGSILECLGNPTLEVLLLGMNHFSGKIPQTFAGGSNLNFLNLNDNQLEGPLPPSLVNCSILEILDVGNNKINDTFPHWLAVLPELQVLILRSNKFHGPIVGTNTRFPFHKLRILDLSYNEFNGNLPMGYIQNFEAMMDGDSNKSLQYMKLTDYLVYYYYAFLTLKGVYIKLEQVQTIFTIIDLSNNLFQGEIPEVVGKLTSLKGLNLSHNNITGRIPSSLGNLIALESLDLSSNKLVGQIPLELTRLKYISVLNLSYNQLEGPIPLGPQFNTFENDSYNGNLALCGFPLSEKCSKDDEVPKSGSSIFHEEEGDNPSIFDWKIIMMGYVSGLVIGLSMGYTVFATGRPRWFVKIVEKRRYKKVKKLMMRLSRGRRNY